MSRKSRFGRPWPNLGYTALINELQAPHRLVMNLGVYGAPTQIARAKSCKIRRGSFLEDESGLGADDFCNSWTLSAIREK